MAGRPSFRLGAVARPRFVVGEAAGARFEPNARRPRFEPTFAQPRFELGSATRTRFDESAAAFSQASGAFDAMEFSSQTPTSGAGTGWIGDFYSDTEAEVLKPTPGAGTIRRLYLTRSAPPGAGASITYIVRKNGTTYTALSVVLASGDTSGATNLALSADFLAGERVSIEEQRSGDVQPGITAATADFQKAA